MNKITFGRYSPKNTFIHRLDPRFKIFSLIILMVMIFLQFSSWSTTLVLSGIMLIVIIILMIISRISFISLFKSLATMWILIIILLLVYIFIPMSNYKHVAFYLGNVVIYWDAFYQAGYIVLRLVMMLSLTMILTSTTKPMDLTYAFEWYMTPFKIISFPVSEIAMTLSIALRFIPTLLDETDRIMKAQASRGVDFNHGRLGKRIKAIISLIIPLFVSAIERSEELSNAMEARGYDPKAKRTRYRKLSFSIKDLFALLIIAILFGGLLTLFILDKNMDNGLNIIKIITGIDVGF